MKWIDFQWEHHKDGEVISVGGLFARNLHHAKYLCSFDAEVENGDWVDREKCSILPLGGSEYISLFPRQ